MFSIPDDILEELTCDCCHKYLSVGPVEVDKNRRIKCGRCKISSEIGVVSIYRHFGENVIFKCINRFDGCNELLTYGNVIEHEKKCISKHHHCPLCGENKAIPTYKLVQHLKNQHRDNFLKKTVLQKELNQLQLLNKFIYFKGNFIFIVVLEFRKFDQSLRLNAFYIGEVDTDNIHQKYYLYVDNHKMIQSTVRVCSSYQEYKASSTADIFRFDGDLTENSKIAIHFDFLVPIGVRELFYTRNEENSEKKLPGIPTTQKSVEKGNKNCLEIFRYMVSEIQLMKNKRLICGNICDTKDRIPILRTHQPSDKLVIKQKNYKKIEVNVNCRYCSNVSNANIYISFKGKEGQLVCEWCAKLCSDFLLSDITDQYLFMNDFWYLCRWKCGYGYKHSNIDSHEVQCRKQAMRCLSCNFQSNRFYLMKLHLKKEHGYDLFPEIVELHLGKAPFGFHTSKLYLSNSTSFFCIFSQPNILVKCFITQYHDEFIGIKTECVHDNKQLDILILLTNKTSKDIEKYAAVFENKSDPIDIKFFPIRMILSVAEKS